MRILPYTLQGRFLTGLMLAMLVMGVFFALALRSHTQELLASEAREKANIMVAHTEAIQSYVRSTLRPAVSRVIGADDFIIEAMSTSFVSRHILSALSIDSSSFLYRRVAVNARNPDYEMTEQERQLSERFAQEPGLRRIDQRVRRSGAEHMVMARPIYFDQDCMRCHGEPDDAPAVLLSMYGAARGFGKEAGDLAGLDIISVSMDSSAGSIMNSITMFALWFALGMLLLFAAMQGFFNRLVVHNLRRVADILQRVFFPGNGAAIMAPLKQEVEIEGMVRSIEAVATHLGQARQQLSDYAEKLESMVLERTADLESVAAARNADVQLFVSLLSGLNHTQEKRGLLLTSLQLIARHFGAQKALYACGLSDLEHLCWPVDADIRTDHPELEQRLRRPGDLLSLEEPELHAGYWLIPVQTTGHTRGVLGLFWNTPPHHPGRKPSLAMALGRQLGIALDNLDALDALLLQNSLLDTLVEGVPDPLLLVEGQGAPLLANTSACELAKELASEPARQPKPDISPPAPLIWEKKFWKKEDGGPGEGGKEPFSKGFFLLPPAAGGLTALLRRLDLVPGLTSALRDRLPAQRDCELPDGRSFTARLYPLCSGNAPVQRAIIHLHETTAEKRLLLHLRRSEKLAVVGQLAAGIAHEINNPLGVIRCYAELLDNSLTTEQERADLQIILHHVDQAQSVLRDLLDFSRPRPSDFGPCRLEEFLPGLLELFAPKAAASRVSLGLELAASLPVIQTDKSMLEQVLVNLLLNALTASPPGQGRITLGAAPAPGQAPNPAGQHVYITVGDNGPGIAEDALGKIFDPFYTTGASGTGLGLTVAFGMVREMKGRLEVRNRHAGETTGAIFSVILPVQPGEEAHV